MSQSELYIALAVWVGVGLITFFVLLKVRAPYGRYARQGWGPTVGHRQGWMLMEVPAVFVFPAVLLGGANEASLVSALFILAWEVHYVHRAFVFPLRMGPSRKQMPLLIVLSAVVFNVVNGYLNGVYLGSLSASYPMSWLQDPRFIAGAIVFVAGLTLNLYSDTVLLQLRKNGDGYGVPEGGPFRLISCPNYLGEIVEWVGFAIMTWSPAAAVFAFWTAANLVPRAVANHEWYRETFEQYPKSRKALVPFLF